MWASSTGCPVVSLGIFFASFVLVFSCWDNLGWSGICLFPDHSRLCWLIQNWKSSIAFEMSGETNRENWEHFYFSDASQVPVVQKLNSIFHQIACSGYWENQYYCTIQWIELYRVDSAMHLFNNWGQISEI